MPKSVEKCVCCSCGEQKSTSQFYKSNSEFYSMGILPICKECFSRKFGQYSAEYHSNKMSMQRMCMAFDIYFNEDLFDKCDTNDDTVVGKYFRQLNMTQNRGKTFDTTIEKGDFTLSGDRKRPKETRVAVVDQYGNEQEDESREINKKDIKKWGIGFNNADYEVLNSHYEFLKTANPNCDSNQEIFINDLCYTKMQQMKAVREGRVDDYNKLTESYRKSFQQAGLRTVRDDSESKDFITGVTIATMEKYSPAEFYKNQKLYKDFDGIGGVIKRFFTRPVINLQYGMNVQDDEYSIKDDDEDE